MVTEVLPPKVSGWLDPATTDEPLARRPICAAPIASGVDPISLDRRTRSRLPPMLARTMRRMVWPLKVVVLAAGGGPAGAQPQVAVQPSPRQDCAMAAGAAASAPARTGPDSRKRRRPGWTESPRSVLPLDAK